MQLGRLEIIDQAQTEHIAKISKVESLEEKQTIQPDERYKNLSKQVNEVSKNEVILDNVKFGFDKETGDFFVRVSNGDMDIQYPTEQIMKMKAHFKKLLEESIEG